jgi:predicted RND superfamily exporter protein
LLTRPTKDLSSFTSAENSIGRMREIISDLRTQYPNLGIGLTGLPVLENEEMVASQQDTQIASLLALAGVALLFVIVYRCVRYPFLTVTTLLVGTAWAFGWLTLTVGHLNILSATFAVMLIGLGDYGVLWVTRYEQERAGGHDGPTAMRLTTLTVGPSILIAALTTARGDFHNPRHARLALEARLECQCFFGR